MHRIGLSRKRSRNGRNTVEAPNVDIDTPATLERVVHPTPRAPIPVTSEAAALKKLNTLLEEVASIHKKLDFIISEIVADRTDPEDFEDHVDDFEPIPPICNSNTPLKRVPPKAWPADSTGRTNTSATSPRRLEDAPRSPRASTAQVPYIKFGPNSRYTYPACNRCSTDGFLYCSC